VAIICIAALSTVKMKEYRITIATPTPEGVVCTPYIVRASNDEELLEEIKRFTGALLLASIGGTEHLMRIEKLSP
jgi:hypothetical protein